MSRAKHFRSMASTIAVVFLFAFSLSVSFSSKEWPEQSGYSVAAKRSLPSGSNDQPPYEEKDTEKDELQDDFFLAFLPSATFAFAITEPQSNFNFKIPRCIYFVSGIPLYLIKQAFLI